MNGKWKIAMLLGVLLTTGALAQTLYNVSGTVLLEDEIGSANHAGVKVAFYNLPDLTPEDSTFSNADGAYSINISPGYYLVEWTKTGYVPWELGGLSLAGNTVLDSVILIPGQVQEVSGAVSGTWTTSFVYYVTDSIWVPAGDSLTINPGVRVKFDTDTGLECYGKLKVLGTETEPVLFTSRQPTPQPGDWQHVTLYTTHNTIQYLNYEWATTGIYGENASYTSIDHLNINGSLSLSASGLYFQNSDHLTLTNNTIAVAGDYGIFADYAQNSQFTHNTIITPNNGIRCYYAHGTEIGHNVIKTDDNTTGPSMGILANFSQYVSIEENQIIADQYGIDVGSGHRASIESNRITGRIYWKGINFRDADSSWVYRNYVHRTVNNGENGSWQYLIYGEGSPGSIIRSDTLICVDLPDWYQRNMALRCEKSVVDSNLINFRFSNYENYAIHDDDNSDILNNTLIVASNSWNTQNIIRSYKTGTSTTYIENNDITYDHLGESPFQYAIWTQNNTIVRNNTITGDNLERAIYVQENCVVDSNIIDADFSSAGAIYINGDSVSVLNNLITNRGTGTTLFAQAGSNALEVANNTFINTQSAQWLSFDNSDARIHHNTVELNGGNGFEIFNQSAGQVYNNTLVNFITSQMGGYVYNQTNIPVYNNVFQGFTTGINAQNSIQNYGLDHNAFWNVNTTFAGTAIPPLAGQIIDENDNGDPADIYGNIKLDPRFSDPANGDFTLQSDSPLINAGRGTITDPDGTASDMGAFYRHIWVVLEHTPLASTIDTTGPYPVNARVFTTQGVSVAAALHYSIDGGNTFESVPMTNTVADTFYTEIPGQSLNTTVQYYLSGTDSIHTAYAPKNYTTNPYSFYVTLFGQFANLGGSSDVDGTINLAWTTPAPLAGALAGLKLYRSTQSNVTMAPENLFQTFDAAATTFLDTLVEEGVTYHYRLTGLVALEGDTLESLVSDEVSVVSDNAAIVRVRGVALLADTSEHTGTKVYFEKSSPSAQTDSTYTDVNGFYDQILKTGIYNVHFTHSGYQPLLLGHQFYSANTLMDTLTLVPGGVVVLAGTISDTLFSNNLYLVNDHLTIPAGETLTIQAGTQVMFTGNYNLTANGRLMVQGTPDQKVVFGSRTPQPAAGDWGRIMLSGWGASGSEIKYATYRHGSNGLYLSNLDTVTIQGMAINSLPINSSAIIMDNVQRYNISGNTLSSAGDWVVKKVGGDQSSYSSIFSNNTINGPTNGVYLPQTNNSTLSGNEIFTGGTGINIDNSYSSRLDSNRIDGITSLYCGISINSCNSMVISNNYVRNAYDYFYYLGNTTFSKIEKDSCVLNQPLSDTRGFYGGSQNEFTDIFISMTPENGDERYWYGFESMQSSTFRRIQAEIQHANQGGAAIFREVFNSYISDSFMMLNARYNWGASLQSVVHGNGNTLERDTLILGLNTYGVYGSNLNLKDVIIRSPEGNNNLWAVTCTGSALNMDNMTIESTHGVTASGSGGVIRNSMIKVLNSENDALQLLNNSTFTLYQNTLVGNNSRYGIWSDNNSTIVTNSNLITGFQTAIQADAPNTIQTSLLYNNTTNFSGSAIPQETGSVVTVNANNDPSDIYGNIFLNPLFVDAINGDYHLQATSPAVNAGDIDSLDLDGTTADIGAFFYNFGVAPYDLAVTGTDEETITVGWDMLASDSIVAFIPYYRTVGSDTWLSADSTEELSFTYNGLVNNQDYELAVSCRYPGHETGRSQSVIARPGVADLSFTPGAIVRYLAPGEVPAITFNVVNTGTKTGSFTLSDSSQISHATGTVEPGASIEITDTLNLYDYWGTRTVHLYESGDGSLLDTLAVLFGRPEYRALAGSHFGTVNTSPDSFTVVITGAYLDGEPLQIGDEIAVYDVGELVGSAQVAWGFPIFITCFGTTPGDPLDLTIWDMSQDQLIEPDYHRSTGAVEFQTNAFTVGSLYGSAYQNVTIPLEPQRFNLISFNTYPRYTNANMIFGGVDSLAIVYNDLGQALIPQFGINTLGNVNLTRGYHVFSYAAAPDVSLQGLNIHPANYPVTVRSQQFNSIAYLGKTSLPVGVALSEIDTLIDIVQDDAGGVYIPDLGVNTLQNMVPGKGYQIFTNADSNVTFTYPETTVVLAKQSEKFPVQIPATRFKPVAASGLPYTIVVQSLEVDGHDFAGPGEIGIYDGELCVGAVRFTDWPAVITTWEGSEEHGIPGYMPGHEITFHVWMDELAQTIEAQHHAEMAFGEAPYGLARLTSRPGIIPETFYLEQNYPNPFNPTTHIRYGLPEKTEVSLVIYDITGREVWRHQTGVQSPGKYEVEWRGNGHRGRQVASGIYLYRIQAGSFSAIKKMTLIR